MAHLFLKTSDSGILQAGQKLIPFYFTRGKDRLELWMDGKIHEFEISPKPPARAPLHSHPPSVFEVTAPMPGKILRVSVQEGREVEPNQPLAVLESMKMEMTITAPMSARIAAVACRAGDSVEMGRLLMKLEALS